MDTTDIVQMVAIDEDGVALGIYAVARDNPEVPGLNYTRLVDFPSTPQPTGEVTLVPGDPGDPSSQPTEVPVVAWPTAGWRWNDGVWST